MRSTGVKWRRSVAPAPAATPCAPRPDSAAVPSTPVAGSCTPARRDRRSAAGPGDADAADPRRSATTPPHPAIAATAVRRRPTPEPVGQEGQRRGGGGPPGAARHGPGSRPPAAGRLAGRWTAATRTTAAARTCGAACPERRRLVSTAPRTHGGSRPRTQLRSHDPYRPNSASAAVRLPRRARASSRDSDEEPERATSPAAGDAEDRVRFCSTTDRILHDDHRRPQRPRPTPGDSATPIDLPGEDNDRTITSVSLHLDVASLLSRRLQPGRWKPRAHQTHATRD